LVAACPSVKQTTEVLDAALGGEHQRPPEAEALVVGMGGDAEEPEGGFVGHGSFKVPQVAPPCWMRACEADGAMAKTVC